MTAMIPPCRWQELTSAELAGLPGDAVAALVLGAIEQHGPHLPLSTDLDIGEGLLSAAMATLPEGFPLVALPAVATGASEEHGHFPGTLSLPAEALIAVLEAYGGGLAASGIRRLVLVNAHGGNNAAMDVAALRLRRRHGMCVVKYHYPRSPLPDLDETTLPARERAHGLHGGAVETALMQYLHPQRVRLAACRDHASSAETGAARGDLIGPEAEGNLAWLAEDLHPAGVVGDARLGTATLGERLLQHYAERLRRLITEVRALGPPGAQPLS